MYNTYDVRAAYDYVRDALVDQSVRRVVLIGHSQGSIVISMVLDRLFASMASEDVAKIEVYTFGSAASHFNNPRRRKACLAAYSGVVRHIEHYINGEDLVPRWGVLKEAQRIPQNRYAGKVFVRIAATGHMLNQHYLSQMFPLLGDAHFLDQKVLVDTGDGNEDCEHPSTTIQSDTCLPVNHDISSRPLEQSDKTARELSRLWRYMGGKDPDENRDSGPCTVACN